MLRSAFSKVGFARFKNERLEMRVLLKRDGELEPLWNGADAYLPMWESSQRLKGGYSGELTSGVRDKCREIRPKLLTTAVNFALKLLGLPSTYNCRVMT